MNIWISEPPFPASDLPSAEKRVIVGSYWVDCLQSENPTLVQVEAVLASRLDLADIDNLDRALKALALLTRQYANGLKAGTFATKTIADVRSDFMALYRALA